MKNKILKASLVLLVIASIYGLTYLIMYNTVKYDSVATNLQTKTLAAENSTSLIGTNSLGVSHSGAPILEAINKDGKKNVNKFYVPREGGRQTFCIQFGGEIIAKTYTVEELKELYDRLPPHITADASCIAGDIYARSNSYFVCVGNHRIAKPDLAYLISEPEKAGYGYPGIYAEEIKQLAIWLRTDSEDGVSNNIEGVQLGKYYTQEELSKIPIHNLSQKLLEESRNYQTFEGQLSNDESNAIKLEDKTNYEDVKVSVDTEEEPAFFNIGPFKMDYVEGTYGGVSFGGIANMYMEGYNADGKLVKKEIPIDYFLLGEEGENEIVPDYFKPSTEDKRFNDHTEQGYPKSGETFYIKVKNPNIGLKGSQRIKTVKIKIEFQWMRTDGEICYLDGRYDQIKIIHGTGHKFDHCHGHGIGADGKPKPCPKGGKCCWTCHSKYKYETKRPQQDIIDTWGTRRLYSLTRYLTADDEIPLDLTMELGGKVWQDEKSTKETTADGIYVKNDKEQSDNAADESIGDVLLPNVKVTLYEYDKNTGKSSIAELIVPEDKNKIKDEEVNHSINPTLTDENGEYLFTGIDSTKKYYVVFEYNGQVYMPTEYMVHGKNEANGIIKLDQYKSLEDALDHDNYNTENWEVTSKATEAFDEDSDITMARDTYDKQFEEIGSNPKNYISTNSLSIEKYLVKEGRDYYNESFSRLELMGYTLNRDGKYEYDENKQLMDGYKYNKEGLITTRYSEGVITKKIKEYIERNKIYPDEDAMFDIYNEIVDESDTDEQEMWKKLQFIEDCKIEAYTGSPLQKGELEVYPAFDTFVIDYKDRVVNHKLEHAIYPGQYYINLGLWQRQEFDAALRKDVYKATLKINDKTVVYNYDKRYQEDKDYWDINIRMSDYDAYYNLGYNREIYDTDYLFNTSGGLGEGHPGDPLEIYITYKITIRNQSMSIMGQIKEVVDYYDKDYTYKPNLSWVIYQTEKDKTTSIKKEEYYSMMEQQQEIIDKENTSATDFIKNSKDAKVDEKKSKYGKVTHSNITDDKYNALYVGGLEDKKLATGESAYIYLTFEVNKDSSGRVILDDESSPKDNIAEINGYKTYYKDETKLPNKIEKSSNDISGLLDRDSNPGNLNKKDIKDNDRYEKNFEDDTDRAPSLRALIDEEAVRKANGTVWEDERTQKVSDSMIGDGIRQDDEIGVKGITVQLIEKGVDDSGKQYEYIWQETTTNNNGKYNFENYIPGDYVIRFFYGDKKETALTDKNEGANVTSYNGHDFKSTLYQTSIKDGIDQDGVTDISGRYQGYIYTDTQNVSGPANPKKRETENIKPDKTTYGYNILEADKDETNYSDAKDIWSTDNRANLNIIGQIKSDRLVQGRQTVIDYSKDNVTNHKAEVLASPYQKPTYNGKEYSNEEMNALYNELMDKTYMTAETGVIVVEFEYDRQQSDGYKDTENNKDNSSKDYVDKDNRYNSKYTLNDIDFGLVERPKAQLEIDKSVANVKVTLANGSILFDINKAANNAIWQDHKEYELYKEKDKNGMYEEYYNKDHRYAYRTKVDELVTKTDKGLIQLTMDQELMHGATIQITYTVKITNVGEIDYLDDATKDFYYKGDTSGTKVVTTTANQVVDYVANNLQFDANNQANKTDKWTVITAESLIDADLVNNKLAEQLAKFNAIIDTDSFGEKELVPRDKGNEENSTISKTVILSQMITPENEEDDLTYGNMVEIIKTSNTVGRRMAYSVVGNQNPTSTDASEVDSNVAEKIVILPPFGEERIYYILGTVVAIMLIGGIILIRKKVLNGKDK